LSAERAACERVGRVGEKILGIVMLAIGGAILGDMLINYKGTQAIFSGVGGLLSSTYTAAAGGYSK
jgi:hypothetical protein